MKCEECGHPCPETPDTLLPVVSLSKDAIAAIEAGAHPKTANISAGIAGISNNTTARMLVDIYYSMQDFRKATASKKRACTQGADPAAGTEGARFILSQMDALEANAKTWLTVFIEQHPMRPWFRAVHGIGPVLASGLVAHLGGRPPPPTVGHWYRFAGYDPTQKWLRADKLTDLWEKQTGDIDMRTRVISNIVGRNPETVIRDATTNFSTGEVSKLTKAKAIKSLARIPFNRKLKTLCWKVGDQFVKLGDREDAIYAIEYRNRKARLIVRNERGKFAQTARETLKETPKHAQADVYRTGKLPDGRIDLMARRETVKLFLSHLHELWYELENGKKPPHPFSTTIKGHAHYIPPPHREALFA